MRPRERAQEAEERAVRGRVPEQARQEQAQEVEAAVQPPRKRAPERVLQEAAPGQPRSARERAAAAGERLLFLVLVLVLVPEEGSPQRLLLRSR